MSAASYCLYTVITGAYHHFLLLCLLYWTTPIILHHSCIRCSDKMILTFNVLFVVAMSYAFFFPNVNGACSDGSPCALQTSFDGSYTFYCCGTMSGASLDNPPLCSGFSTTSPYSDAACTTKGYKTEPAKGSPSAASKCPSGEK